MPTSAEVRRLREQLGLTQEEAAALLGITRVGWARYEADGPNKRAMSEVEWAYWKHVAGLERIPFRKRIV